MAMMMDPSGVSGTGTSADPAAAVEEGAGDKEAGAFTIEIAVDGQGNITVSLEDAAAESAEGGEGSEDQSQDTPAKNISDALRIARQLYDGETGGAMNKSEWDQEASARGAPTASSGL